MNQAIAHVACIHLAHVGSNSQSSNSIWCKFHIRSPAPALIKKHKSVSFLDWRVFEWHRLTFQAVKHPRTPPVIKKNDPLELRALLCKQISNF